MADYLVNAFSLQMIETKGGQRVMNFQEIEQPSQEELQKMTSAIGHKDLAQILGVECNRINVKMQEGDTLYVAQLQGGRLPEGATTLPEGFTLKWYKVNYITKVTITKEI